MPQWLQWTLVIAGLLAIVVLSAFIVRQGRLLKTSRQRDDKNREFRERRRESMVESLQVIAMAVEENQVEYSEACLRLKGLLDHVAPELLEKAPYRIFRDVSDQLQHMPTTGLRVYTGGTGGARWRSQVSLQELRLPHQRGGLPPFFAATWCHPLPT